MASIEAMALRHAAPGRRASWRLRLLALPLALLPLLILPLVAATAEATEPDLMVLARSVAFLERPPRGQVEIGIVFPGDSAAGRAEAERVAARFGPGLRAGAATLAPRLLPVEAVGGSSLAVLLLTDAAAPQARQVAGAVAGRGVLTVATDPALVRAGHVVMSVRSAPRVEILVSRAAAQASGVDFVGAFRMMIQER